MKCVEIDILLCDYVDGTLPAAQKAEVETHLRECAACAEAARDASAAVQFMARVAPVEPPPELVTHILFELRSGRHPVIEQRRGLRKWLGPLFAPILQPRFAMGMAMTILSFSMLGRFAGIEIRQLRPADLNPTKVWAAVDDRVHKSWDRTVQFYESIRLVYEVQSRLRDWVQIEDAPKKGDSSGSGSSNSLDPPAQAPEEGAGGATDTGENGQSQTRTEPGADTNQNQRGNNKEAAKQ
jgi:hypothetical protein